MSNFEDPSRVDSKIELDLTSPEFHAYGDTANFWEFARAERPISWYAHGDTGFWVVSRYADAVQILSDEAGFVSSKGNILDTLISGGDSASGRMLPVSDGDAHRRMRRNIKKVIGEKITPSLTDTIGRKAEEIIYEAKRSGTCDFARSISDQLPLAVISEVMDIPLQDRKVLQRHASGALASSTCTDAVVRQKLAQTEILTYFAEVADSSSSLPDGVFFKRLAEACEPSSSEDKAEIIFNCYSLLLGGDETARLALTGAAKALSENSQQWEKLRTGEIPVDKAVEELLRWTSPAMHAGRVAAKPHTLHGAIINPGDIVIVWLVSANFDPLEFREAQTLNLERVQNRHLSFGYGPHFCVGAKLARLEFIAVLKALIRHVKCIEINGPPVPILSNFLRGYKELPVRLH